MGAKPPIIFLKISGKVNKNVVKRQKIVACFVSLLKLPFEIGPLIKAFSMRHKYIPMQGEGVKMAIKIGKSAIQP